MGYGAGQINKSQQPMGQRLGGMPAQGMGRNLAQPLGAPVPTPYNTTPDLSQQIGQVLQAQPIGQQLQQLLGQPLAVQGVAQTTPTGDGYMPAQGDIFNRPLVQPPAPGPERAAFFANLAQQGGMPAQGMGQPQTQSAAMAELQRALQGARTTMQPGAPMGQPIGQPIGQPMSQEDLRNLEAKLRAMPISPYNTTPDLSQQRQRPQRQRPDFFNAPFSMQGLGSLMRRSRGRR